MARTSERLPGRFPVGSTYVVEARGSVQGLTLMHRYVQFPDGRRVELAARLVRPCQCAQKEEQRPPRADAAAAAKRTTRSRQRKVPAEVR